MKHVLFLLVSVGLLIAAVAFSASAINKANTLLRAKITKEGKGTMQITSSAFENNQPIPDLYTCKGQNINPPLSFSKIPENAKSLVFVLSDPDAPGGTFIHWIMYNISPVISGVDENSSITTATLGQNSSGKSEYTGPCPPSGTHHYHFTLYALDTYINDAVALDNSTIESRMQGHIIDQAEIVGLFTR